MRTASSCVPRFAGALLLLMLATTRVCAQTPPSEFRPLRAEYEQFMAYMHRTHGFDQRELHRWFSKVQTNQGVIKAITAPSTAKPWYEFKPLFIDDYRITNGARFWNDQAELLARARQEFGVPEPVIVAIIGIETRYGRSTGGYRVIEALATLAFDVPERQDYFRSELEQFLLLAREQGWDPLAIKGSFAGAMGLPQFMPSSYRRRAIDYSGDGHIDLWNDYADIIGSVASYLHNSGWKDGLPVVLPARIDGTDSAALLQIGVKPSLTMAEWSERGVRSSTPADSSLTVGLFSLELLGGPEFWLSSDNFFALLQYNRSRNYAMAVHDLAHEIQRERERGATSVSSQ
jgi:membrane-bound lytic murein transglycosylase B